MTYDVDAAITTFVEDRSLGALSSTSRYMRDLIGTEETWRRRVLNRFGSEYLDKPDGVTWKRWCQVWSPRPWHYQLIGDHTIRFDPIGSRLGLSPREAGIRLLTQDGFVVPSSNGHPTPSLRYQGVVSLMRSAIASRDIEALTELVQLEAGHNSTQPLEVIGRGKVIRRAYKNGFAAVIKPLYDITIDDVLRFMAWDRGDTPDSDHIYSELSREFAEEVDETLSVLAESHGLIGDVAGYTHLCSIIGDTTGGFGEPLVFSEFFESSWIIGLLKGGHAAVVDPILSALATNGNLWMVSHVVEIAVRRCPAALPTLKSLLEPNMEMRAQYALGLIAGGDIRGALEYERILSPQQVVNALRNNDPEGMIIYVESIRGTQPVSKFIGLSLQKIANPNLIEYCAANRIQYTINTKTVSPDTYIKFLDRLRDNTLGFTIGKYWIYRYDLIEICLHVQPDDTILDLTEVVVRTMKDITMMLIESSERPREDNDFILKAIGHDSIDSLKESLALWR